MRARDYASILAEHGFRVLPKPRRLLELFGPVDKPSPWQYAAIRRWLRKLWGAA